MKTLTKEQQDQKVRLDVLEAKMDDAAEAYYNEKKKHDHVIVKTESGMGARCAICKDRFGWWCPKSEKNYCEDTGRGICRFCGISTERK